jgi:tetratricopeptide (TPR) repeat protein
MIKVIGTAVIKDLLYQYLQNPKDSNVCFELALEYEKLGQTASATGFYLRSIEFGFDIKMQYEALCRIALCFEKQGNRWFMIKGILLRAISLLPNRPEAHFLLCRAYERNRDWQEGYTHSILAESIATSEPESITDLEYPGKWVFTFEKAVVAWWIGLHNESIYLFKVLKNNNRLTKIYKNAVENNLKNLTNNL